jgi:hypothetical protein
MRRVLWAGRHLSPAMRYQFLPLPFGWPNCDVVGLPLKWKSSSCGICGSNGTCNTATSMGYGAKRADCSGAAADVHVCLLWFVDVLSAKSASYSSVCIAIAAARRALVEHHSYEAHCS